jgi:hypothetical protein
MATASGRTILAQDVYLEQCKATSSSVILVATHKTRRCHALEYQHLDLRCRGKLQSHYVQQSCNMASTTNASYLSCR